MAHFVLDSPKDSWHSSSWAASTRACSRDFEHYGPQHIFRLTSIKMRSDKLRCSNFNHGPHSDQDCPWQLVCKGCHSCHSWSHRWRQCPERCSRCGTIRHTRRYCIDSQVGNGLKAKWHTNIDTTTWPYPKSFKTTWYKVQDGKTARWGLIGTPSLTVAPFTTR